MVSVKAQSAAIVGFASLGLVLALAPVGTLFAQQPGPAQAAAPAGNAEKGKALFESASCNACHTLAAAGASGDIGPTLDGNANLTHELIVARVKNGQGAMPPFAGQLSDADIEDVAAYVLSAAAK